jgi:hypothetical protein
MDRKGRNVAMNNQTIPESEITEHKGYCCYCKHNPEISIVKASKITGNKCNGCWFVDEKPNWEMPDEKPRHTSRQD